MPKLKIGITGTGSLIGQAIIKSIKSSSWAKEAYLIGFDYFPNTVGSFWVQENFILKDILKKDIAEKMWLDEITHIIKEGKIKILFAGVDFELRPLSKNKSLIEAQTGCKVMVSDQKVIEITSDKYLTYKFLKENNFSYPDTFLPEEILESLIAFPCIIKPRIGSRSKDMFLIKDKAELKELLPKIKNPIIQEIAGDPDAEYTCGVICFDGKVKEMIVLLRTLKDGNTDTASFSKDTPEVIYSYVREVSEKLGPYGACNFQLRLDAKGVPKIFEINARHSGTTYIRSLFGFNEVEYILNYLQGRANKKITLREGLVKRYFDELFIEQR